MKYLSRLLFFAALLSISRLHGQDAKPADDAGGPAQVSLRFDWISLPHADANRLIRQQLMSVQDATALRQAVDAMIAAKKATLLDINTLIVRSGQRAKLESIHEKPYPTEFDLAEQSVKVETLKTQGALAVLNPAAPFSFVFRNLGRMIEVEATVSDDRAIIDLNLASEWGEHLADVTWGQDNAAVQQPLFHRCRMNAQLFMRSGVWQLAAQFTPPAWPVKDTPAEVMPLPDERVMLFVRASVPGAEKAKPAESVVKQVGLHAEWIELDQATLSNLLDANPAANNADAMRAAVDNHLTDGSAKLIESTFVQCRGGQRCKVESGREYAYPTEFDPPQVPGKPSGLPQPASSASSFPSNPSTPGSFLYRDLGVMLESECTVGEDRLTIDLNLLPEFTTFTGRDSFGQGAATVMQPRFHTMKQTGTLLLRAGQTALFGTCDPCPMPEAAQHTGARPPVPPGRKLVLFVRATL